MKHQKMDEYLLSLQLITQEQLTEIHIQQEKPENADKRIEDLAVELGYISEITMCKSLAAKYRVPYVDLASIEINPDAVKRIPEDIARKYTVLAVSIQGRRLCVAAAEPLDAGIPVLLESLTGMEVFPLMAVKSNIRAAIDNMY